MREERQVKVKRRTRKKRESGRKRSRPRKSNYRGGTGIRRYAWNSTQQMATDRPQFTSKKSSRTKQVAPAPRQWDGKYEEK